MFHKNPRRYWLIAYMFVAGYIICFSYLALAQGSDPLLATNGCNTSCDGMGAFKLKFENEGNVTDKCEDKIDDGFGKKLTEEFGKCVTESLGSGSQCTNQELTHMGIGRDPGAALGPGQAANSCHYAGKAIDVSRINCGGNELNVLKGSQGDATAKAFFEKLGQCLNGKGFKTKVYDDAAHQNHLHVELDGCQDEGDNKSKGICGQGGGGTQGNTTPRATPSR